MTRRIQPFAWMAKSLAVLLTLACATPAAAAGFVSPSGNIICYVGLYGAVPIAEAPLTCLIFEAEWDMPADYNGSDPNCDLDSTRMLTLPAKGRPSEMWACHGDVFWPAPLGRISYGSEWSLFAYTCTMATRGVTCTNGDKTLFVSRATRSFF